MKRIFKKLILAPLILLCPSLMAATNSPLNASPNGYNQNITFKKIESDVYNNVYEFKITNSGNKYIRKNSVQIYDRNTHKHLTVTPISKDAEDSFWGALVKPSNTGYLYARVDLPEDKVLNTSDFNISAEYYKMENKKINVSGPYNVSTEKETNSNKLKINCNIDNSYGVSLDARFTTYYRFFVSLEYDGEHLCVVSEKKASYSSDDAITVYSHNSLDLDKLTIENIEGCLYTIEDSFCGGVVDGNDLASNYDGLMTIIIVGSIGVFLIGGIVTFIILRKKKLL